MVPIFVPIAIQQISVQAFESLGSVTNRCDDVERMRIVYAAQVTGRLAEERPRHDTTDNLSAAGLGQGGNHEDVFWRKGFSEVLCDRGNETGFGRQWWPAGG